jgi:hypothetical protein
VGGTVAHAVGGTVAHAVAHAVGGTESNMLDWLKKERNVSDLDRLGRVILGEGLMVAAYFWLGGLYAILCWVLAAVFFLTAATGFCPIYFKTDTASYRKSAGRTKLWQALPFLLVIVALPPVAGYASIQPTTKNLIQDFVLADGFLKQTTYDAEVEIKELAAANFDQWKGEFKEFSKKYAAYRPFIIKGDRQFTVDLKETGDANQKIEQLIYSDDLQKASRELSKVQARWSEVFHRNGMSFGNKRLIDFGALVDDLEDSAAQVNAPHILITYPKIDLKMQELELIMEPSAELFALRQALEELTKAGQRGDIKQMPQLGKNLKQAYLRLQMK